MKDVCNLDTALCLRSRRPAFLDLISLKVLLFNREEIDTAAVDFWKHDALEVAAIEWIIKRRIHLASLRLQHPTYNVDERSHAQSTLTCLASNGHIDKLELLSVSFCREFDDDTFNTIISKCNQSIVYLRTECTGMMESGAECVMRCKNLVTFVPDSNESAAGMADILQSCEALKNLTLWRLNGHDIDIVVKNVVEFCPTLIHLDVSECDSMSDDSLTSVAATCRMLEYIDLFECPNLTDRSVLSLYENNPRLTHISLGGNMCTLTDAVVVPVASRFPHIIHISLTDMKFVTPSAVQILASRCCELKFIGLSGTKVGDKTLKIIAQHCPNLEELRVLHNESLSDDGLGEVVRKCAKLKYFYFSNNCLFDESIWPV
jgi:hypothetical protein